MDEIPREVSVIFTHADWSLITSVELDEEERREGETDDELAIRQASDFMHGAYGWDVAGASQGIGVVGE